MTLTTPLPSAPSRTSGQETFSSDMDTFNAALPVFQSELEAAAAAFGPGAPYCTVGGTANALTLAPGFSIAALSAGQRALFIPNNTNTLAATLNLAELGDVTAKTITGATMPAGYLRAGVLTSALYTGTEWWVDRLPEKGGTASNWYRRLADGTQICGREDTASGSAAKSWSFGAAFVDTNYTVSGNHRAGSSAGAVIVSFEDALAGSVKFNAYLHDGTRQAQGCLLTAVGNWY